MIDVLHQDQYWLDAHGREHVLTEMAPSYRRNVLHFLRRNARKLEWEWRDAWGSHIAGARLQGEMAQDAFDSMMDHRMEDPEGWLEGTVLVVRLVELVAADRKAFNEAEMF